MGFDLLFIKRSISRLTIIAAICFVSILLACGGGGGGGSDSTPSASTNTDGTEETFTVTDEASLNALQVASFDDATDIGIYRDSKGTYSQLNNGDIISAASPVKLGIKVQNTSEIKYVFAGNGGGYLVNATFDESTSMYLCSYQVPEKGILAPVIVSAVHKNKKVTRKKIVLRTENIAKTNQLIRDGFGLLVGKNILEKAKGVKIDKYTVKELVPVNNSDRYIMQLMTNEIALPIKFNLYDGLSGSESSSVSPSLMIDSPLINLFNKSDLGLQSFLFEEDSIKTGEGSEIDLKGLNLDKKPLYLVANGLPLKTTDKMAALMLGLFMYEGGVKGIFPPNITLYKGTPAIDFSKSSNDASSIELSLSEVGLTQLASTLFNGSIVAPAVPIDNIIPKYDSGSIVQKTKISLNKEGIAFDFSSMLPMISINDLRVIYLENNVPVWEVSIDIAAYLEVSSHNPAGTEETFIDAYLKLVPALTRLTVIKDSAGIKISKEMIDALINDLKTKLPSDDPDMDFLVSVRTDSLGVPINSASISSNGNGRCLVKIKTFSDRLDFEKTGACFIETAAR